MKLFIPKLGTKLRLTKCWSFNLHCEQRNIALWDLAGAIPMDKVSWSARRYNFVDVMLMPGDVITVDRIFIRKGAAGYNSVTFRGQVKIAGVIRSVRFWVTLEDANNIECEVVYA